MPDYPTISPPPEWAPIAGAAKVTAQWQGWFSELWRALFSTQGTLNPLVAIDMAGAGEDEATNFAGAQKLALSAFAVQQEEPLYPTPTPRDQLAALLMALDLTEMPAGVAYLSQQNIFTNVQSVTPYRANISGAVSIDLAAAASNNLHLTLTGNVSSFALTNPAEAVYNFRFIQDGTGSRTFSGFPAAVKFAGGTAPTFSTTAGAVDFMSAQYGSTEGTYMASFLKGMA